MNILRHSEYSDLILVDGYNLLFADKTLKELSETSLEEARLRLESLLSGYSLYVKKQIVVIYDGHFVKDNRGDEFMRDNLGIVEGVFESIKGQLQARKEDAQKKESRYRKKYFRLEGDFKRATRKS